MFPFILKLLDITVRTYSYCSFFFYSVLYCNYFFQGKSITDSLQISVTKPGFYYAAALQINLPLSLCGKVNVYCYFGDYKVNITNKNFNSCQFQGLLTTLLIDLTKNSYIKFKSLIKTVHDQIYQHRPFVNL